MTRCIYEQFRMFLSDSYKLRFIAQEHPSLSLCKLILKRDSSTGVFRLVFRSLEHMAGVLKPTLVTKANGVRDN